MINPALVQICASEEHRELLVAKAPAYLTLAARSLSEVHEKMTPDEIGQHIAGILFTLFACGFEEGVKAGNAKKN